MKKIITFILGSFLICSIPAQDEIQTLFGKDTRISGFGGPFMTFTSISGEFAHMMGGGGGVLLGDFFLGGYGEGLTNYVTAIGNKLEFGHGGFWTGFSFFGNKAIHPCISAQIGWGGINQSEDDYTISETDNVFVVNPTLELEMNFTKFFRLSLGANYKFVTGVNTPGLANEDFSNPGAFLAFKFGWY